MLSMLRMMWWMLCILGIPSLIVVPALVCVQAGLMAYSHTYLTEGGFLAIYLSSIVFGITYVIIKDMRLFKNNQTKAHDEEGWVATIDNP